MMLRSKFCTACSVCLLAVLSLPLPALADLAAGAGVEKTYPNPLDQCGATNTTGAAVSCSLSGQFGGGTASGSASYGVLHAFSSVSELSNYGTERFLAVGSATFSDSFIISGASSGALDFTFASSGNDSTTCANTTGNGIACDPFGPTFGELQILGGQSTIILPEGSSSMVIPIGFSGGQGFAEFTLLANSECGLFLGGDTTAPGTANCVSISDWSDTAQVTSLTVVDSNGNPIPGATVTAVSGTDYNNLSLSAVPEPSSFALTLSGVIGFFRVIRRRARITVASVHKSYR